MRILIPSSNRWSKQTTYENLPPSVQEQVSIIVPQDQWQIYNDCRLPAFATTPDIKGIGPTRQWICDSYGGHILMLDDDLVFAMRRRDVPTKFYDAMPYEVELIVNSVQRLLDEGWAHGAVAAREGANRVTSDYQYNVRCLRALFYNADILEKHKIKFTDMEVMEDFHVALSLLELGYPSITINWAVQNQNGSNLPGGCSDYRTMEVQSKAAFALMDRHPRFVTVVEKETKTAWGGQPRKDVRVAWKEAYRSGLLQYNLSHDYPVPSPPERL